MPVALQFFPPSFFAIVLGLAGLANTWRAAHTAWLLAAEVGELLYVAAFLAWLVIAVSYALKWFIAPVEARREAEDPVQCCFIGLAGVSTLLIAQGVLPYSRPLAIVIFFLGAGFTFAFGVWRTGILWRGGRDPATTSPVLYLPFVAGGFVTGIVAAAIGWKAWGELAFGAAFFGWLAIESVLIHRLYTSPELSPALRPTLGIQMAPSAVGAACYLAVNDEHSYLLVHMMMGYAVLQLLLLIRLGKWIAEQPFGASYWAFTFGITAMASAAIRLSKEVHQEVYSILAPVLFLIANIVVISIAIGTLRLIAHGRFLPTKSQ